MKESIYEWWRERQFRLAMLLLRRSKVMSPEDADLLESHYAIGSYFIKQRKEREKEKYPKYYTYGGPGFVTAEEIDKFLKERNK